MGTTESATTSVARWRTARRGCSLRDFEIGHPYPFLLWLPTSVAPPASPTDKTPDLQPLEFRTKVTRDGAPGPITIPAPALRDRNEALKQATTGKLTVEE